MSEHMNFENGGGPAPQDSTAAAVDHALQQLKASNKRKRDSSDLGGDPKHLGAKRASSSNALNGNGHDANDLSRVLYADGMRDPSASQDFNALTQQLARHVANANANHGLPDNSNSNSASGLGMMPQLTVPQPTELSFVSTGSGPDADRQLDASFDLVDNGQNHNLQGSPYGMGGFQGTSSQVQNARESSNGGGTKPAVGSDEWHKVRRDNHKEVERRRRETINEGINELAKIVPGCEKNKGSILQRAVQYITQLRENETKNIEKWTLEKMLTEQAIAELSHRIDDQKMEIKHLKELNGSRDLDAKGDDDAGGTDDEGDT